MDNRKLLEEVMAAFNSEAPGHWRVFEIEQVAAEIVRRVEAALAETEEVKVERVARVIAMASIPAYAEDEVWADDLDMWRRRRARSDRPSQDNPIAMAEAVLAAIAAMGE